MVSPFLNLDFWVSLSTATMLFLPALIIAGMGETFSEQTGVLNIGLEGYMLTGALTAFATTFYTGNPWLGFLSGILVGLVLSLIHAVICINLGASQFVSGIGFVLFSYGLTGFWYRLMVEDIGERTLVINYLDPINIPFLSQIPIVGQAIFQQNPLVYIALAMVPICTFISFRTSIGLNLRAVGFNPVAAESVGIDAYRMRYIGTLLSGGLGGLAGAYLSIQYLHTFADAMTAGIGFIVIAIVIVGNWSPHKVLGIGILFGFVSILQYRLLPLNVGIPYQFLLMLPYVITIIVLIVFRKISMPRTLAFPYKRAK